MKQSSGWSAESTMPPTGDGFHKAAITLGEGDKSKTASVTYGRNVITYQSDDNGNVSGAASATVGSKIEFTVTPSANYTIDAITVKDADNQNVTLTGNAFTMPEKNVTVSATFKAIAYTVTVNGAKATVKDNTPNPVTFKRRYSAFGLNKLFRL